MKRDTQSLFVPVLSNGDGKVMVDFMMSLLSCLCQFPTVRVASYSDSLVSRARNIAVCGFLTTDREFLLFWDADIIAQPHDLARLSEHDDDILCGIYPKKMIELVPVFQTLPGRGNTKVGGLEEVARSGTGFMRIHRSVFERMKKEGVAALYENHGEHQWDFFPVGVVGGEYLSEDWWFCDNARSLGIKVMLDTRIQLRHQGLATYPILSTVESGMFVPKILDKPKESKAGGKLERVL
jgi:hypothetical protein